MTRQGKGTKSATKSTLKKVKRVAAKARKDLAGAFTTKSVHDIITSPLDAVNESPVQIPKKSEVIPALSLALPSPTAKFIQDRLQAPPETVTIPNQSFTPPSLQEPFQEPVRDNLSVPTIRLRLKYEAIPINFAYLVDVEDCSSEDELRSHAELLTENRRRRISLASKIKELVAKDKSQKAKKPEEQYRRDAIDQTISISKFTGKETHNMFREDLRTETLTCQNWPNLVKVRTNESELNFLDKYMLLTYKDLQSAKQLRPQNKISTSRNMYIAVWRALGPASKQQIYSYLSKINGDGPILL